jgi:maleylacetoacetate isomerase
MKPILYGYWRSSCSWRVRISLYFKGIDFEYRAVNLLEPFPEDYSKINKLVPTLMIDNKVLTQSIAILEYLEERRPETWRLIPVDLDERFHMRAIVQMIASDIQPIQNLRVLKKVKSIGEKNGISEEWGKHWISEGFNGIFKTYLQH